MGPIPFPSERQLVAILVLALLGGLSLLAGALALAWWLISHVRWVA